MGSAPPVLRIAVDAMGGDHAPGVIVEGALEALREHSGELHVSLVGDQQMIERELVRLREEHADGLSVVHAPERVEMEEKGATSVRRKRQSSVAVATKLLKDGDVSALVSAGNTGAVVSSCLLILGRLPGVSRPAIATFLPTEKGGCILLDVGATSDCKPENLVQFAVMGSIYAKIILNRAEPRVGLLNIGEESTKGNELAVASHKLLASVMLPFVGNIEGRDVLRGRADVIVCDGFTGNILLKFSESIIGWLTGLFRESVATGVLSKINPEIAASMFAKLKGQLDYAEYGGAPLLGVDGVCIIAHGSSSARAVKNAIRVAVRLVRDGLADRIRREIAAMEGENE
jgi:glycerol-3-phosphate acyltransferase PlsX